DRCSELASPNFQFFDSVLAAMVNNGPSVRCAAMSLPALCGSITGLSRNRKLEIGADTALGKGRQASRCALAAAAIRTWGKGTQLRGRPAPLLSSRTLRSARCRQAGDGAAATLSWPRRLELQGRLRDRPRRDASGRTLSLADQHLPRR